MRFFQLLFIFLIFSYSFVWFTPLANAAVPILGDQKIAVVFFNSPSTIERSTLQTIFSEVNNYYREVSYAKVSITADIYGSYAIQVPDTCEFSSDIAQVALDTADPYVNFQNYDQIVFLGNFNPPCFFNGENASRPEWITDDGIIHASVLLIDDQSVNWQTIAHEMGHGFGLGHARALNCGDKTITILGEFGVPIGCSFNEYGSYFSIMAFGTGHIDLAQKEFLGWLDVGVVQEVLQDGVFTLAPLESNSGGLKALKIKRANDNFSLQYLYVEYRQPIGYDAGLENKPGGVFEGALLLTGGAGDSASVILDATPVFDPLTPALLLDQTFIDPETGVSIKVINKTVDGLTVQVDFPNSTSTPTPSLLLGDANEDGKVDGVDFVVWLNNYSTQALGGRTVGDFNEDSRIDGLDYVIWLSNYGA
jgi:M6 family metalloprotease-like protein